MEVQTSRSPHPLVWVAAIALIVFCGAGVAALMGWIPTAMGGPSDRPGIAAPARAAKAEVPVTIVAAVQCVVCGVIQSVREIDAKGEGSGLGAVAGNEIEKRVRGTIQSNA